MLKALCVFLESTSLKVHPFQPFWFQALVFFLESTALKVHPFQPFRFQTVIIHPHSSTIRLDLLLFNPTLPENDALLDDIKESYAFNEVTASLVGIMGGSNSLFLQVAPPRVCVEVP